MEISCRRDPENTVDCLSSCTPFGPKTPPEFGANYTVLTRRKTENQQLTLFGNECAFSDGMKRRTFNGISGNGKPRDWREICMEVLQEPSSERANDLLEELLEALEERSSSEGQASGSPRKI